MTIHKQSFPNDFLWGTATAAHQVEGNCNNNNWYLWERTPRSHKFDFIPEKEPAGIACDHWNRYPEDIALMRQLGINSYRFSLEWSKIEPEAGRFDQKALNHYSDVIDCLLSAEITPMITLHHFTHPIWFNKVGAFEKQENIHFFVRFAKLVFNEFSERVKYWCTINEPAVITTHGYFTGIFPPEKQNLTLAALVLENLMLTHVKAYKTLKSLPNGNTAQIGLVKNITQFKPWRKWHPLDWAAAWVSNYFFNTAILNCLKTNRFKLRIPGFSWKNQFIPDASDSFDFFGLNYYSHNYLQCHPLQSPFISVQFPPDEIKTDMPYTIYPQGFYDALHKAAALGKPLIVTENGVADAEDNFRDQWIKGYVKQLSRAIQAGLDIRGFFYWSLLDNYEWAEGYKMKFGLYEVSFHTQERKLRQGSKIYQEIIESSQPKV